jgi:hypothetical protein
MVAKVMKDWQRILGDPVKIALYDWPTRACAEVLAKIAEFFTALADYDKDSTHGKRIAKVRQRSEAEQSMRSFANSFVRYNKKMDDADKLSLGIRPRSKSRMTLPDPVDQVSFWFTTIPEDHRVIVTFRIAGKKGRSKWPYHSAEVRYWIRELNAPPPGDADEGDWHSEDITSSPWHKTFPSHAIGKFLYVTMRWRNASSSAIKGKGPWCNIFSVVIP